MKAKQVTESFLETEKTKEYLKCILTEQELRDNGLSLARANSRVSELEARKKEFADQIKADVSAAEAQISKLALMLQNGYEYRDVECEVAHDFDDKVVITTRMDTGEVIKTRPMNADELQGRLSFNEE